MIDSGTFDWKNGNFPLDQPDSSYHGLRWGTICRASCSIAFILRISTVPLRNLGACISDNSWQFIQGIETLPLRMERHCENALTVAKHLKNHASVEWARFPGLEDDPNYSLNQKYLGGKWLDGGLWHQGRSGSRFKFIDNLKLFSTSPMWGMPAVWRSILPPPLILDAEDQQRAVESPGINPFVRGYRTCG